MKQLALFDEPDISTTDKLIRLLTAVGKGARNLGVKFATASGYPLSGLLIRHLRNAWEWDFKKVWASFDRHGKMIYAEFDFGAEHFCFYEDDDGHFYANEACISSSNCEDFGEKLIRRYLNESIKHIRQNGVFFSLKIKG